jgi:tetraacyldisaccharide 4'-kinase
MASFVSLWLVREGGLGLPGKVVEIGEMKALSPDLVPVRYANTALVAGSTREGDEEAVLSAWRQLDPRPLLVLAPRHANRFAAVAELLGQQTERWHRWSQGPSIPDDCRIVLVDTHGDLQRFYPLAAVAFVGGTFTERIGGHSPAEASAAGLPVVRGPYFQANEPAWGAVRTFAAETKDQLSAALREALDSGTGHASARSSAQVATDHLAPWLGGPVPEERPLRPWLWPAGWVWRSLVALRNRGWRLAGPTRVGIPVISVGGLGSGGAGKTPVVAALVHRLRARGLRPAVLARGFGRVRGGEVRTAPSDAGAAQLGDEMAMLAEWGLHVISAPDRIAGAQRAIVEGADCLVLDDGFQHRKIHRDLDIVVVDPRWPIEGGPIPVGEAREGFGALGRADLLWLTSPGDLPNAPIGLKRVRSRQEPTGWLKGTETLALDALPKGPITAVAGIARPGRFLELLVTLGLDVRHWRCWPDHHPWTPSQEALLIEAAKGTTIVCTEKDRVRFSRDFPGYALRVELELSSGQETLERLLDRVFS